MKKGKVLLAYSGGLDTSIILAWLQDQGYEVATFTANLGQKEDFQDVELKAAKLGVKECYIEDLQEEFVKDYVWPMFRANCLYEGSYLLGTAIARPLIAKRQIEIAKKIGAGLVAHGATGKGNDQVRFELGYYGCDPNIGVISPWRDWSFSSRTELLEYAQKRGIEIKKSDDSSQHIPFSIDSNLLHNSFEGNELEDPAHTADMGMLIYCATPENAPNVPTMVEIEFANGDPIAVDGHASSPANLLRKLNEIAGSNGVGVIDIVENRYVGLKSRGVYETPGGTLLLHAHRAIESITLDAKAAHLKDEIMPKYAEVIYNGYWWSPEREMLQALIDKSQEGVSGVVTLKLYKGSVTVVSRSSSVSLYCEESVSFQGNYDYDPADATGFIHLNALRLKRWSVVHNKKNV